MKYKKVICIDNTRFNKININKLYLAKQYNNLGILYHIYDEDFSNRLGLFPCNLFKTVEEIREERLNDIL